MKQGGKIPWSRQNFFVTAHIAFTAGHQKTKLDTALLRQKILEVDQRHPFLCYYKGGAGRGRRGRKAPSIGHLGEFKVDHGNEDRLPHYTAKIEPPFMLSLGKVIRYYRYVATLTEKLAELDIPGVNRVGSSLQMGGAGNSFKTPSFAPADLLDFIEVLGNRLG
jgi:hypothetical protein